MEENNNMTAERSLQIIAQSIEQSRKGLTKVVGKHFVLWGIAVMLTAISIWALWNYTAYGAVWNLMWCPAMLSTWGIAYLISRNDNHIPNSFVTKVMGYIWGTFGIIAMLVGVLASLAGPLATCCGTQRPATHAAVIPITAIIILMFGMQTAVSGQLLKNKLITISGLVAGLLGFLCALVFNGPAQHLVLASSALVALLIPGIIISARKENAYV